MLTKWMRIYDNCPGSMLYGKRSEAETIPSTLAGHLDHILELRFEGSPPEMTVIKHETNGILKTEEERTWI